MCEKDTKERNVKILFKNYVHTHYKDHWDSRIVKMLHITFNFVEWCCMSRPANWCSSYTHISYHNKNIKSLGGWVGWATVLCPAAPLSPPLKRIEMCEKEKYSALVFSIEKLIIIIGLKCLNWKIILLWWDRSFAIGST